MLKLPKSLAAHPKLSALEAHLAAHEAPLREGSAVRVPRLAFDDAFRKALGVAHGTGHLGQGLEQITRTLEKELKGLRLVQEKTGQPPAQRASRLIILANDGSERFYRDAEKLLSLNADRLLGFFLETAGDELGTSFTAKGNGAKALIIDDKVALALFLSAYADALC